MLFTPPGHARAIAHCTEVSRKAPAISRAIRSVGFSVKFHDILYTALSGHPLHFWGAAAPAVHRGGPLARRVELAHQAAAVVHQNPFFDPDQLHALLGQGFADFPATPLHVQLPLAAESMHFCSAGIFPSRRVDLIATLAAMPERSRRLHAQRLVRTLVVIFLAKGVEPRLLYRSGVASPFSARRFQRAVESFHFSLRLRMPIPAQVQLNSLLHYPYR